MARKPVRAPELSARAQVNDDIGEQKRLEPYRTQVVIREAEQRAYDLFLQNLVKGTSHLSLGQEAIAAGFGEAMVKGDLSFCTHRGHAHTLARGVPIEKVLGELMQRDNGLMRGKGGSMHLTSEEHGVLGSYAIVGAHLPIACGAALRAQYKGEDDVTVCFFGDGTTNIGAFHEALNFASVWKLPVIFVCENNLYMEYTPIGEVTAVEHPAADRASAYGLDRIVIDGNDADIVYRTALSAYDRARAGQGPSLIECMTYRHSGHSRADPTSQQAILVAAIGAAMTGLKPIAEIMFSDFFAVCFDYIANEFPKSRYMSDGQLKCPLVVRTANGAGSRFGAQHSQSVENWAMMIPGLKVVAPSTPRDVIGLLAAAVRDPDPVSFLEHKSLYAVKGEVPDGEIVDTLGTAKIVRPGKDATILALALMVPRALEAAEKLKAEHGIDAEVIDVRSLVPLDTQTILGSVGRTHRLFTVEENPRLCGWGAEIVSIVADEAFYDLDGPPVRITTPHIPLPAADILEDMVLPNAARIAETVRRSLGN